MPSLKAVITDFVIGDNLSIRRTIDRTLSTLPDGTIVTQAWMTVKNKVADTDVLAIFQKVITTSDVAGVGQIENDGTGDVDLVLRFDLVEADTRGIGVRAKFYDIQIKTNTNKIYTPEKGRITGFDEITIVTT